MVCIVSAPSLLTFQRSTDGLTLLMSSSDGFCSCLAFSPGELGIVYEGKVSQSIRVSTLNTVVSQQTTPSVTPVTPVAPTLPRQQSITSAFGPARPASPARSMSTSSSVGPFAVPGAIASGDPISGAFAAPVMSMGSTASGGSGPTSEAATPTAGTGAGPAVLMHQTPTLQSVPSVAATHSAPVPNTVPSWGMTPPETPGPVPGSHGHHHPRTHSASSSMSGVMGKPDAVDVRATTELEQPVAEEAKGAKREGESEREGRPGKRRRVEPTRLSRA